MALHPAASGRQRDSLTITAGVSITIQPRTTGFADALVIVDMQNGFIRKRSDLVDKVGQLARRFPPDRTWWLKYRNHPGSMFARHLDWHGVSVSPETDIVPELRPLALKIVEHTSYMPPAWFAGELASCNEVALAGMDTDACIQAAAFYLWDHGIRPLIAREHCASSRGTYCHRAALDLMRRQFGSASILDDIVPTRIEEKT